MNYTIAGENLKTALNQLERAIQDFDRISSMVARIEELPEIEGLNGNDFERILAFKSAVTPKLR